MDWEYSGMIEVPEYDEYDGDLYDDDGQPDWAQEWEAIEHPEYDFYDSADMEDGW